MIYLSVTDFQPRNPQVTVSIGILQLSWSLYEEESVTSTRKNLRDKPTRDLGFLHATDSKIFISESLTSQNRSLFNRALEVKKKLGYLSSSTIPTRRASLQTDK